MWRIAAAGILLLLLARPGLAATPRDTEVGSEEERLRRPKKLEVPPRVPTDVQLPPEEPLLPPGLPSPTIHVRRVAVEGSTLLSDEELKSLVAPLIDKTVTLEELQKVADGVTRWYRSRGYITSRAFIPAQTVEGGLVRIRVIEGKVGQLKIEGNKFFSTELLQKRLKVPSGEVLKLSQVEEGLRTLNAHPDRKAKLILTPGKLPETTDLILQVSDQRPFHANYGIDTLGTKVTGEFRNSLLISHGNLTGHDDQMVIRGIVTEFAGLWGGTFSYLRPLNPRGVTLTFDVSGVKSSLGGDLKNLLARGEALTISPGLILPLLRRTQWELEAVGGFDAKRIRTRRDESTNSKDDLRVLHLGANLLEQDSWGTGLLAQEFRLGIGNLFGGSHPEDPAASRARAGGSFLRWVVGLARIHKGPWGSSLVLRASSQVTTDRLVPAEQFRLGGFETVRGYPEGEFLADAGYQTSVELRAPAGRLLAFLPKEAALLGRLKKSLLLLAFWDFAEGYLRNPATSEDQDERLSGLGCGLRLRPTPESVLQMDFGWAIGDADREKDRPRVHLICRIGF